MNPDDGNFTHQPPPLKNAPAPPPRPPPLPPKRLRRVEVRLVALEAVLAWGRITVSPAFTPSRTIVELFPVKPVRTLWRTFLPPRRTVTAPPEMALVGTFTPSACSTTTSALALIPGFNPEVI